jgi:CheY-like chemotaxis protein
MSPSILVVDDEPDVALLFRHRFHREVREGTYVMHFANSGEMAPEQLTNGIAPTLIVILSDIYRVGPFDRAIRASGKSKTEAIISFSARHRRQARASASRLPPYGGTLGGRDSERVASRWYRAAGGDNDRPGRDDNPGAQERSEPGATCATGTARAAGAVRSRCRAARGSSGAVGRGPRRAALPNPAHTAAEVRRDTANTHQFADLPERRASVERLERARFRRAVS